MVRHRTSQLANSDNVVGLCSTAAAVLFSSSLQLLGVTTFMHSWGKSKCEYGSY